MKVDQCNIWSMIYVTFVWFLSVTVGLASHIFVQKIFFFTTLWQNLSLPGITCPCWRIVAFGFCVSRVNQHWSAMEFTLSKGEQENKILYKKYNLQNNLHSKSHGCKSLSMETPCRWLSFSTYLGWRVYCSALEELTCERVLHMNLSHVLSYQKLKTSTNIFSPNVKPKVLVF